jgi:hypothetical protein
MNFLQALEAITPESLIALIERIPAPGTDPTLDCYSALLEFVSRAAASRDEVSLMGIAHTIYGWMPTMLAFDDKAVVPEFWANTEAGSLDVAFLEPLKKAVNNSVVGASKVLHFLNPEAYAIWDSRVFRGITSLPGYDSQVNRIERFVEYTQWIREFSAGDRVRKLMEVMVSRRLVKGTTSRLRAVELCLFCMDQRDV